MGQLDGRIVVDHLTKQFKKVRAVDDLSFTVEPGTVTGFLGPNGAGKTTTLRMLLGLVTPTSGTATIGCRRYQDMANPFKTVGAALEASSFHKGRTGRNHLRVLCAAAGLPDRRADEVLEMVGMTAAANRKVRGYSLGMKQRLGLAATMLGNPRVLLLDEPANGLDPEGIRWLRGFLRGLADQGRTVLVSSHLLAEVAQTADDVVIIAGGRSVRQGKVSELTAEAAGRVRVTTPHADRLVAALDGARVESGGPGVLYVHGADAPAVGRAALAAGAELHELTTERSDLEQVFLDLTTGREQIR
ncbi:MAG TPA: ABC transporter ATP-binding protein [Mycobacteriales bacterium]|jgi:ABC-2 type transport system ATP-binding protein|nr:ABC transporter ATP-binding protein [Mycobacteriales bacterium]